MAAFITLARRIEFPGREGQKQPSIYKFGDEFTRHEFSWFKLGFVKEDPKETHNPKKVNPITNDEMLDLRREFRYGGSSISK